ncbi:MAG: SDR family NAD(P)-dependent oxidoreductase, partial [Pseudomonadales bacterium]
MVGRVEGKIAIVTGAASGLGLACAQRLAEEGATVVVADVAEEQGRAAADGIVGAEFAQLDVTSEPAWQALVDDVVNRHGRLDVLVNNAGVAQLASIEETTEEIWRRVNSVGTDGTFYGCKHALRAMKDAGRGSIINMCS